MNLIGHMVCAEDLGPEAALGAMLPDLLSLYDRGLRPHKLVKDPSGTTAGAAGRRDGPLAIGLRFHFFVDSAFHRAPLFTEGVRWIRGALEGASPAPGLKRFAAAHVLVELFLDHLLVVEEPARLRDFYAALHRGRGPGALGYLAALDGFDGEGFSAFLLRLGEVGFADGYRDRAHLLDRTERILGRLRQRRFDPAERRALLEGLDAHALATRERLDGFIASMRRWNVPESGVLPAVDSRGRAGIE